MTPQEEAKVDKMIADVGVNNHQQCPFGRNFMAFSMNRGKDANVKYRKNFDRIFPNAPGAGI